MASSTILLTVTAAVLIVSGKSESSVTEYRKCCSSGSALTLNGTLYSCQMTNSTNVDEFLATEPSASLIPLCKTGANLTALPVSDLHPDKYPRDSCTDILYGIDEYPDDATSTPLHPSPHVLFCEGSGAYDPMDLRVPRILKIRRCCAQGEIFISSYRACLVPSEDTSSRKLVADYIGSNDFVHVLRGPPKCENAIVDYHVNLSHVAIVGDGIKVTVSNSDDLVDLVETEESCIDVGDSPGSVVVRSCKSDDYCQVNTCLRKCCLEDEAMVNTTCKKLPPHLTMARLHSEVWDIPKKFENGTKRVINTTEYGLLVGKPCLYGMYAVLPNEDWHMVPEGMVHVPGYKTYEHHQHCVDMYYDTVAGPDGLYPFVCFDDPPPEEKFIQTRFAVNATLVIISCAFLLTTLCVYVCLPTLQNLHGKTLMSHVGSLFMAYVSLALVAFASPGLEKRQHEVDPDNPDTSTFCTLLGYSMLFFFLSTFFWLNVMCFDIWWKFGSLSHAGRTNTKRRDDIKRFIAYSIYAWGLSLLFTVAAVVVDSMESLPYYIQPNMGYNRCWFQSGKNLYGQMIFFTGPVSVQLLVNLVFFILTARRCSMVKAEIRRRVMVNRTDSRSRRFEADKSKLILNGKLFIVMGMTWLLEIVSYALDHYGEDLQWKTEFFYVSDALNCLQGLLIFVLFVLKKKVLQALRRKFGRGGRRRGSTGTAGILDPYRVRKSPSSSTILSTFAVSSSP